jgi:predicted RNase H-like HicB family nuclease
MRFQGQPAAGREVLPPGPSSVWSTNSTLDTIDTMITLSVELVQEEDGRWIAEVRELPGVLAYGKSAEDARARAQALALRVVADRLEHGEAGPDLLSISFKAA